jgi:hypothetical protein
LKEKLTKEEEDAVHPHPRSENEQHNKDVDQKRALQDHPD